MPAYVLAFVSALANSNHAMVGTIFIATMDFLRPKHSHTMPDKKHPNGCAMKEMLAVNYNN